MTESMTETSDVDGPQHHKSIGEVLTLLQSDFPDVSISKIRFLESRGLIQPHRAPSGYRKFAAKDIDRLRWILTMQRDHFLPLRVIKERLDDGPLPDPESTDDNDIPTQPATPVPKPSRFRVSSPAREELTPSDLGRQARLSAQQLDQLIQFGLIEPHETPDGARFTHDELQVAQAASSFLQHGIEPRHLKAWRVAAEREAGMLEQIITPLHRKGSAQADVRAREVAEDLVEMGNVIRESIIVKLLRDRLGLGADHT